MIAGQQSKCCESEHMTALKVRLYLILLHFICKGNETGECCDSVIIIDVEILPHCGKNIM